MDSLSFTQSVNDKKRDGQHTGCANEDVCNENARVSLEFNMPAHNTIMISGIPCQMTTERMKYELSQLGYDGTYIYVNVPRRASGSCPGYGFVRFVTAKVAANFVEDIDGYFFAGTYSFKHCQARPADREGPVCRAVSGEALEKVPCAMPSTKLGVPSLRSGGQRRKRTKGCDQRERGSHYRCSQSQVNESQPEADRLQGQPSDTPTSWRL
eukprot:TRINITY_DN19697_c0_g1_i1.p1 TRINITY_DN19697_c0_g1~~TRINITY_DN19697_c0_g1_i1.p1  ORF type:complete len:211 (+),score=14.22 TRINITY_DN19697_c0_g1_i1:76-708(+)